MTTGSNLLVEVSNLTVSYGSRQAVSGLSFTIMEGQSLGMLGVNGAGKSSTLKAILGIGRMSAGTVSIFGHPAGHAGSLKQIGFAPEDGAPPEFLTVDEWLRFSVKLRQGVVASPNAAAESASAFELDPQKKVRELSKGMRRRLLLAAAFLGTPRLLILDEPLNGLDPLIVIKLREKLESYRKAGGSILISSHILSEIERVCSDVLILHEGRNLYFGSVPQLCERHGSVERAFADMVGTSGAQGSAS